MAGRTSHIGAVPRISAIAPVVRKDLKEKKTGPKFSEILSKVLEKANQSQQIKGNR